MKRLVFRFSRLYFKETADCCISLYGINDETFGFYLVEQNLEKTDHESAVEIYTDRIVDCDCHHCGFSGAAAARPQQGAGSSA